MKDKVNKKHKKHHDNHRNSKYGLSAQYNIANTENLKQLEENKENNISHQKTNLAYFGMAKSLLYGFFGTILAHTANAASIANQNITALEENNNTTTIGAASEEQGIAGVTPLATGLATGGAGMIAIGLLGVLIKGCTKSAISIKLWGTDPCFTYTPIKAKIKELDDSKLKQISTILNNTEKQKTLIRKSIESSNTDNVDGSNRPLKSSKVIDAQKKQEIEESTSKILSNTMSKHNPYRFASTCAPRANQIAQDPALFAIVNAANTICDTKTNKDQIYKAVNVVRDIISKNNTKDQGPQTQGATFSGNYNAAENINEEIELKDSKTNPSTKITNARREDILNFAKDFDEFSSKALVKM